ncbi:MAG TPA: hypothetical protein GX530_10280 [Corynebacteriales bacterium]|nr:hypothetical protein [Mycobacteriales bacterium]
MTNGDCWLIPDDDKYIATIYDLCRAIGTLLIRVWGDEWKDCFTPEYPKGTATTRRITYRVVRRVPSRNRNELVHRHLHEISAGTKNVTQVYGRTYEVILQFDIWSKSASEADSLVVRFDDFMATYSDYFRQHGVILIAFMEQLEDEHLDRWREDWYIRSLRFLVLIEDIKIDVSLPLTHVEADVSNADDMQVMLRGQYYDMM